MASGKKKYRVVTGSHVVRDEKGDMQMFEQGSIVEITPEEYMLFADKFDPYVAGKSAADVAALAQLADDADEKPSVQLDLSHFNDDHSHGDDE